MKKEREIIELLEREEINRYASNSQEKENIGKLVRSFYSNSRWIDNFLYNLFNLRLNVPHLFLLRTT